MCFILMLQIALVVALRMTRGLHTGFPGQVSVRGRLSSARLIVLWSTRKFALLHWLLFLPPLYPSPLGYFLAIRIHLLSLPVISVPARCLRRFVYSAPLLWLLFLWASGSLSLSLAFTHLRIPVSYFETQPDPLPAAPLGRDHPARAAKKCFAIKMDDLLSIMFCFVVKECLD